MNVLVMAPHADDETLGVGGTLARLADEGHRVVVAVLTGHGEEGPHPLWPPEVWRVVREEAEQARNVLGVSEILYREIPAVLVPDRPVHEVHAIVRELVEEVRPDTLFLPYVFDLHGDHRTIAQACAVAWRPVSEAGRGIRDIFMYETLSETHWNIQPQEAAFVPNVFQDISGPILERKLAALRCYRSQMRAFPDCRSVEAVEALARWRGSLVGWEAAEAFVQVRRLVGGRS